MDKTREITIRLCLENEYDMVDIIGAFHYGIQLSREQLTNKEHEVWSQILKEIHENWPSVQNTKYNHKNQQ